MTTVLKPFLFHTDGCKKLRKIGVAVFLDSQGDFSHILAVLKT